MSELVITKHDGTQVKIKAEVDFEFKGLKLPAMVDVNNDFWFLSKDVAEMIGLKRHITALDKLDSDEKGTVQTLDSIGRNRDISTVSEAGMFKLVLRASTRNKPHIEEFQRWVTHDVLPSIKKYGIAILEERLNELEPKDLVKLLHEMNPTADIKEIDGDLYICAKDIKENLGLGSINAITYRLREGVHFKKYNRIIYINNEGLKIVVERSRKPEAMNLAKVANLNVIKEVPEASVKDVVRDAFKNIYKVEVNAPFQFEGETNYADILLPEFNVVLEVDEEDHQGYDLEREKRREMHMREVLGWEVLRVNPHEKTYNHGQAVNLLLSFILSKSKSA